MPNSQRTHPMDELKQRLKQILEVVPPKSKIFYIDYPVYSNGGDLLIMKGAEAFFKSYEIQVVDRYSVHDFHDGVQIPEDYIIVMSGGGNFGDLYDSHQNLREMVVQNYPRNKIVILPQTIFYKDTANIQKTADIFNRHSRLYVYARDNSSYELATTYFTNVHVGLLPDMAHQLWKISTSTVPKKGRLNFLRTDIEINIDQEDTVIQGDSVDWASLFNRYEKKLIFLTASALRKRRGRKMLQFVWKLYSSYLVRKAIRLFAKYEVIHTSRLHGHILSCLMAKPNVLIDNSYGKNSGYYQLWTHEVNTANMAGSTKGRTTVEQGFRETTTATV
ncbi:polysaccharide pyruvyl transferase family protein [Paenibacillus sp. 7523-1]|uniref:polysaccharide pyruvyl transferase family protein n=1 Tax=Paenibacillus sp. 7523-1 TaxID=2022550 RepID=UPI000BA527E4|nr:polysaccharide pyruvyl transferase family protein [Paenibacillus sp. 7523-1]PAD29763.1 exopolysaccharide biosynthesis protein [Paenibacillus sp. 7523-1]